MGEIWVSFPGFEYSFQPKVQTSDGVDDLNKAADKFERYAQGEGGASDFPAAFYGEYRDKTLRGLPDFFVAKGYYSVSEKCASILKQFNLGRAGLFPVPFFQNDRVTPIPGEYFIVANIERKSALDFEHSVGLRRAYKGYDVFNRNPITKDGDIAVRASVVGEIDLWIDPMLNFSLFFSGRLHKALKEGGINMFKRKRCTVISGQ